MLIDGEWVDARDGGTLEVYDPALGEVIDHVPAGDAADVNLAVAAARRAFDDSEWNGITASDRGRIIWRIGDLILEHADELAEIESIDNGKPVGVARAGDVPLAADLLRYMAGFATKLHGQTFPISVPHALGAQFHADTLKEPVGVVGQIIPCNFPLLMAAWKHGPALATGCTVVLQPAEQTPLSALHDRARRQVAERRVRRRRPLDRDPRCGERDLLQPRPVLRRGLAPVHRADGLGRRARRRLGSRRPDQGRARAGLRH